MANFTGTSGNDSQNGTNGADTFDYSQGGKDRLSGKNGDDTLAMGAQLTALDSIDGGSGYDVLSLNGSYSGLAFGAATIAGIEEIDLAAGHSYTLTLDNANVTVGNNLLVAGFTLGFGDDLIFDGSDETSASLSVYGGFGDDNLWTGGGDDLVSGGAGSNVLHAGDGDDQVYIDVSPNNVAYAGDGDDRIYGGANFIAGALYGGAGHDVLFLVGDYFATTFLPTQIAGVEKIKLISGPYHYNLTLNAANVGFGESMTVDGSELTPDDGMIFSGGGVEGRLLILGGSGDDELSPGASGEDTIRAGDGADVITADGNLTEETRLNGGNGNDELVLKGDYADKLQFLSRTVRSVETISLVNGLNDYNFATADGTIATGGTLTVDGSALSSLRTMTVDGSAESNGTFHFIGGAGIDRLTGGAGNDTFDMTLGGVVTLDGGDGDDTFLMGAGLGGLNAGIGEEDVIDGGAGNDTVQLAGNYDDIIENLAVENVTLTAGFDYTLGFFNVRAVGFVLDASALGAGDGTLIGVSGTIAPVAIFATGGAGDDQFFFGIGADAAISVDFSLGGDDSVSAVNAQIEMGGALTAADSILGGIGSFESIHLDGDYSGANAVTFAATTIMDVDTILTVGGHSYTLTMNDGNLSSPGSLMHINGVLLGAGDVLNADASAETQGSYEITGGAGDDIIVGAHGAGILNRLEGGGGNDVITSHSETAILDGGGGDDDIHITGAATNVSVDGGSGTDEVFLDDPFVTDALFLGTTGVETVRLGTDGGYLLVVAAETALTIDATTLATGLIHVTGIGSTAALTIRGGAFVDHMVGSDANDVLEGRGGADVLEGGMGADTLTGGSASDTFSYTFVSESSGGLHDTITDVNFNVDKFDLDVTVSSVNSTVHQGSLSTATLDSDLAIKITAAKLSAGGAVRYTPDAGTLAGHEFLIIDWNGIGGYQAGFDYVIDITGAGGALDTGDFI